MLARVKHISCSWERFMKSLEKSWHQRQKWSWSEKCRGNAVTFSLSLSVRVQINRIHGNIQKWKQSLCRLHLVAMIYCTDTVLLCMSVFSSHSISMSQSQSSAGSRLQRSFLHAAVWLRLTWFESNEISGGSYADTPSDGLITEKLRASTLRNTPAPTVPLNSQHLCTVLCPWMHRSQ